ncbi:MAG: hypothetical protein L0H93_14890 [Nocardioides sp.]|nr:hypothetical protein [Nocardioides sp.]
MNPVTGLALGRLAIGATSVATPDLAAKLFRLDCANNPQLSYLLRLFGGREILIGALTLAAGGSARRALVLGGVAVDAVDVLAAAVAGREGVVSKPTSALLMAPAAAAVVAGGFGLRPRT